MNSMICASRSSRQVVAVSSSQAGRRIVTQWAEQCAHEFHVCWVGSGRPESIPGLMPAQAHDRLGLQVDCLILELDSGFSPDAMAIAVGWLRGGGVLCLLVGALDHRPYALRLRQFLGQPPFHGVQEAENLHWPLPTRCAVQVRPELNTGQRQLLEQLRGLPAEAEGQCVLLQAPRGRGKSTLLGALLANWVRKSDFPVVVTARTRAATHVLLQSAESFLAEGAPVPPGSSLAQGSSLARGSRVTQGSGLAQGFGLVQGFGLAQGSGLAQGPGLAKSSSLTQSATAFRSATMSESPPLTALYWAPEQVLAASGRVNVLLVDEAAALPPQQLLQLIRQSERSLLATTTTGFEGSGRYFDLRLGQALDRMGLQVSRYRLADPVRWIPGDALESWLDRLLLLDSEASWLPDIEPDSRRSACSVSWYSGAELASVEARLQAVVVLLREAHYRTRPSDLRRWLDDPALKFALLTGSEGLLGVLVAAHEPGLHPSEADSVFAGERRPQGRFLPCVLAAQGPNRFARMACWRVLRIVVHPNLRRCGIGRRLLAEAVREATAAGAGFIGSSFGAGLELLNFWWACGFQPVQIGFHRESVSGLHAAVVLRGLTDSADAELLRRRERFKADWPIWRNGPLQSLEEDIARAIVAAFPLVERVVEAEDQESVRLFAGGSRLYEWSLPALHRWATAKQAAGQGEPTAEERWMDKVLRAERSWADLAAAVGASGRAGAIRYLRKRVAARLDVLRPPPSDQDDRS